MDPMVCQDEVEDRTEQVGIVLVWGDDGIPDAYPIEGLRPPTAQQLLAGMWGMIGETLFEGVVGDGELEPAADTK